MAGHKNKHFSCHNIFLPYISDKTKKNVVLFVLYLCFVYLYADVCREELLVEIEGIAYL